MWLYVECGVSLGNTGIKYAFLANHGLAFSAIR